MEIQGDLQLIYTAKESDNIPHSNSLDHNGLRFPSEQPKGAGFDSFPAPFFLFFFFFFFFFQNIPIYTYQFCTTKTTTTTSIKLKKKKKKKKITVKNMGFYDEKKKAYIRLKELLKKSPEPMNIDKLVLDLTEAFAVPDQAIKKRLEIMENVGDVEIKGGKVAWKQR